MTPLYDRHGPASVTHPAHSERPSVEACSSLGLQDTIQSISFDYTVRLRHPIGRRAVIDAGTPYDGVTPIIYPSARPWVQHRLERRYATRESLEECRDTPADILAEKYSTQATPAREARQGSCRQRAQVRSPRGQGRVLRRLQTARRRQSPGVGRQL
jgi:hypothetical protein